MRKYIKDRYAGGKTSDHIWLGVSVEDTAHTSRISHLKDIDFNARFISFEPLLNAVGLVNLTEIAWAIVGGESGPGARPMRREWATEIRDICQRDLVEFFFKQWGGPRPKGRKLEEVEWNGFPWRIVPEPILARLKSSASKDTLLTKSEYDWGNGAVMKAHAARKLKVLSA